MEVLVLIDFEGNMPDELTVRVGDVVKNVTKAGEEGWLQGELGGKRGIFPSNFVKEVPVYLMGESNREPRSMRKSRMTVAQVRKCEVAFPYKASHEDELELVVGETIEILREIEDGWWMGKKNDRIGAFPSNFVKEIFVAPKDGKVDGRTRPKLTNAVFNKEVKQRTSIRHKPLNGKVRCQVMFDYTAMAEDELNLKKGEIVTIITKETEDEGWWEGTVDGRRGNFPDNFVMVIPEDTLQTANTSRPPVRQGSKRHSEVPPMEKITDAAPKTDGKDEKVDVREIRNELVGKLKPHLVPGRKAPPPPPSKDKPQKPFGTSGDVSLTSTKPVEKEKEKEVVKEKEKQKEEKEADEFDGVDISSQKLSHPTATRAKPPQRRPPSHGTGSTDPGNEETENSQKKPSAVTKEAKADPADKVIPDVKVSQPALQEKGTSLTDLQAEVRELRMALDLLKTQHEKDMQELKDELKDERTKRTKLQEEVQSLKINH
ncbi:SH3 domain-containing protein 21 isoform X2 [Denticeps clupeoides]|uniref:SH3 domain-containing protein 21 isoform X2 n=1 Tax=Denticeps clupeoides TaxID=299321 RepID=UPI0010A4C0D9|nr:SH3 domain-containing protein 21 isoform X2 [Denticeps clupeoides]